MSFDAQLCILIVTCFLSVVFTVFLCIVCWCRGSAIKSRDARIVAQGTTLEEWDAKFRRQEREFDRQLAEASDKWEEGKERREREYKEARELLCKEMCQLREDYENKLRRVLSERDFWRGQAHSLGYPDAHPHTPPVENCINLAPNPNSFRVTRNTFPRPTV